MVDTSRNGRQALTVREALLLGAAAVGLSRDEVAVQFGMTSRDVESILRDAMSKLGARSWIEAVVIAAREGLIERPEERRAARIEEDALGAIIRPAAPFSLVEQQQLELWLRDEAATFAEMGVVVSYRSGGIVVRMPADCPVSDAGLGDVLASKAGQVIGRPFAYAIRRWP